ncbi:MAG TPA: PDDEXK nuclease domain-containing protein [Myxococcota bacterium]|nr:PDDEXK nuclease domain-containing protein [Myxococcota bacterium]HPV04968.1 PDDEXK nuclease domain-containing protein [Myxococcota bacterium]
MPRAADDALFGRVAAILTQARANVVRAVNHNMVAAYWLIGREIVMDLQRGESRAGYGDFLIKDLSDRLVASFGRGYSVTNLKAFRYFYLAFSDRMAGDAPIGHPLGAQFTIRLAPELTWSHYRALMRVESIAARCYYEAEAASSGWSKRELERQIHTQCYERLVSTKTKRAGTSSLITPQTESAPCYSPASPKPFDTMKDPYVLEFLDIPDPAAMHESGLEAAIIGHLRDFLLELGRGFAFVARQKRLSFDDEHLYVDLVFYSIPLRCYLLIDLKTGKLTHADVGQMDGYVRMFDDLLVGPEDNPTIGLILCTEHNSAVARYSVLNDRRQIFASRYVTCLPTEAELAAEIQRTRALIETRQEQAWTGETERKVQAGEMSETPGGGVEKPRNHRP